MAVIDIFDADVHLQFLVTFLSLKYWQCWTLVRLDSIWKQGIGLSMCWKVALTVFKISSVVFKRETGMPFFVFVFLNPQPVSEICKAGSTSFPPFQEETHFRKNCLVEFRNLWSSFYTSALIVSYWAMWWLSVAIGGGSIGARLIVGTLVTSLLFVIPSSVFRSILMSILTRLHCFIPPINGELSVCRPNFCIVNLCILADFRLDLKGTNHWHSQINSMYGGQKRCLRQYVRKKGKGGKNIHIYIKQNQ